MFTGAWAAAMTAKVRRKNKKNAKNAEYIVFEKKKYYLCNAKRGKLAE